MSTSTIVDTDILIDAGRGVQTAIEFLQVLETSGPLAISVVTQMELLVGCRNKNELRTVDSFLRRFQILPINDVISQRAVDLLREYWLKHGLLIADSLIAATALSWGHSLASGNKRHFHFIPELELLPYLSR